MRYPSDTNRCAWCGGTLLQRNLGRQRRTCSQLCRQALWRFAVPHAPTPTNLKPRRFAYADPPYPGKAHYYPESSEVDHEALIAGMNDNFPDGWALSTSAGAMRQILPLCPADIRVCAWIKAARPHPTAPIISSWEPLIIRTGTHNKRVDRAATKDSLIAQGRYRAHPNAMIGMKPPQFAVWLFQLLGMATGDEFHDLFPGSGAITRAWHLYTTGKSNPPSPPIPLNLHARKKK